MFLALSTSNLVSFLCHASRCGLKLPVVHSAGLMDWARAVFKPTDTQPRQRIEHNFSNFRGTLDTTFVQLGISINKKTLVSSIGHLLKSRPAHPPTKRLQYCAPFFGAAIVHLRRVPRASN